MTWDKILDIDRYLLLSLNGSDSLFWDGCMQVYTSMIVWMPLALVLVYMLLKNNSVKDFFVLLLMVTLVVLGTDQISSGFCKPFFERWRPTNDPVLMYAVDVVNEIREGKYGFTSSHAANTFAVAVFVSLLMRSWSLSITMILWAALNAYSRIYLGVHYPGDILFGTLTGIGVGVLVYILYHLLKNKFLPRPQYISNQYTSSGYLTTDISLLLTVMTVTVLVIVIYGMILGNLLNF